MNPYDLNDVHKNMDKNNRTKREDKYCIWEYIKEFDFYRTGCNRSYWKESRDFSNFKYCPYCGKEIKIDE